MSPRRPGATAKSLLVAALAITGGLASPPLALAAPPSLALVSAGTALRAVPVPARFRLASGLEVLLVERHELPILTLQLVLRTGSLADPPDKAGLAALTADLLTTGAGKRTAREIADTLDFLGATLEAGSDVDKTTLRLDVLEKDLDTGLSLFADALLRPTFAADELDRERQQRIAALTSMLDDANRVIALAADQSTYRSYPYGRPAGGTKSSLARITREDVAEFHARYYRPDGAFLVVVGDTSRSEIEHRLGAVLGEWTGKRAPFAPPDPPAPLADREVRLVDMDVTQSYIQLENIAIRRNHPDFFPALLMTYILGGGAVARLYKDIRDTQGLAYGAYSYLVPRYYAGKLTLELQTKLPNTDRALTSLLAAMGKMRDTGPTEDEMALARDYYTGSFALRLESGSDLAREVTNVNFFGLGDDYLPRYQERIRAVTRRQVQEAARKYLTPAQYALTIVTKAAEVEPRLSQKFGRIVRVSKESLVK